MNIYEKKVLALLTEAPPMPLDEPVEDPTEAPQFGDEGSSDMETAGAIDDVEGNPVMNFKKEQRAQMTSAIGGWISRIEDFNGFLNGLDGNSMQAQLNSADCDTIFNDVGRSETKKISRIAQDLSALVESLKGYLLSHEDKQ